MKRRAHADLRLSPPLLSLRPDRQSYLGRALQQRGRIDEAVAAYKRAIELKWEEADLHYSVGILDDLVAAQPRGQVMLRALLQEIARLLHVRAVERCTAAWLRTLIREAMEDET